MIPVPALRFPFNRLYACLALGVFALSACIQRDNPFDPINAKGPASAVIRDKNRPTLERLAAAEKAYAAYLEAYLGRLAAIEAANAARAEQNASILKGNEAIRAANDSIEAWNNSLVQTQYQSLREKSVFGRQTPLSGLGPDPDFAVRRDSLQILAGNLFRFMTTVNAGNKPLLIYPEDVFDSVLAPFARDSAGFAGMLARIDSGNSAVDLANSGIYLYNSQRDEDDLAVGKFNRFVEFLKRTQNRPPISNPDSLSSSIFAAKAGDTLILAAGTFIVDLRFSFSGTRENPIVVRGPPGGGAILKAAMSDSGRLKDNTVIINGQSFIRFEDIVFRNAGNSGVKIESKSSNISFKRCQFDSNGKWGVEVLDSEMEMTDCIVRENGGGVRAAGGSGTQFSLTNTLVVRNRGVGVQGVSAAGEILRCTISDNDSAGIHLISPTGRMRISNTIVSGNKGIGILRNPGPTDLSDLDVSMSDIWGNQPVDWELSDARPDARDGLIQLNLSIDPEFADSAGADYSLKPGSVLAGYETQPLPVIIGYRP